MYESQALKVWDILVRVCDAPIGYRWDFVRSITECGVKEYRFQGNLEFGGKFYVDRIGNWVSCYPEDETPEREKIIQQANTEIAKCLSGS